MHPEGREIDKIKEVSRADTDHRTNLVRKACETPASDITASLHESPAKRQRLTSTTGASTEDDNAGEELHEQIRINVSQQVRDLQSSNPEIGTAWTEYCTVDDTESEPNLDPSGYSLVSLIGFLRSQQVAPDTVLSDNEMLLMALTNATNAVEVLDACDVFQEGLTGLTVSLALCLVSKFQSFDLHETDTSPRISSLEQIDEIAGTDARVSALLETVCAMAIELSAPQLVQSICAASTVDSVAKTDNVNLRPLVDATLSLASEFYAADVARVSLAFVKLLPPAELSEVFSSMAEILAPQKENLDSSELVQILEA